MNRVDLKVVLLGNAMVGKTSLMERYVHDSFNDRPYQNLQFFSPNTVDTVVVWKEGGEKLQRSYKRDTVKKNASESSKWKGGRHIPINAVEIMPQTIGTVFAAKRVQVNDVTLVMGIWDTAGSEKYDAMTRTYYRGAKAAIVCYDVTKSSTFQRAKHWVRELRSIEENCKIYLCGTKKDLCDEGFVSDNLDMQNIVERYANGTQTKLFITSSKTGENVVELFNEVIQDFASNPENFRKIEETIVLSEKSTRRCCGI